MQYCYRQRLEVVMGFGVTDEEVTCFVLVEAEVVRSVFTELEVITRVNV